MRTLSYTLTFLVFFAAFMTKPLVSFANPFCQRNGSLVEPQRTEIMPPQQQAKQPNSSPPSQRRSRPARR